MHHAEDNIKWSTLRHESEKTKASSPRSAALGYQEILAQPRTLPSMAYGMFSRITLVHVLLAHLYRSAVGLHPRQLEPRRRRKMTRSDFDDFHFSKGTSTSMFMEETNPASTFLRANARTGWTVFSVGRWSVEARVGTRPTNNNCWILLRFRGAFNRLVEIWDAVFLRGRRLHVRGKKPRATTVIFQARCTRRRRSPPLAPKETTASGRNSQHPDHYALHISPHHR